MKHTLLALTLAAAFSTAQASPLIAGSGSAADAVPFKPAVQTPAKPLGTNSQLLRPERDNGMATGLAGINGAVMYAYGQSHPTITCAPLHICTITLLDGEHVTNISIGDSVRWLVQATTAGHQPVVIVKPTEAGLVTNLVITTDAARVYYLTLASKKADYIPLVGFYDPQQMLIDLQQEAAHAAAAEKASADAQKLAVVAPLGEVDPATLDFDFVCKGDDGFKPLRVFAAAGHTYLQMPPGMKYIDAPAVFNTRTHDTELMNSRLVHDYYIVDGLSDRFKLVLGVGNNAHSVECTHGKPAAAFNSWGE